ncbi:hypothetical protein KR009_009857, partial [Drosophila setifemur]
FEMRPRKLCLILGLILIASMPIGAFEPLTISAVVGLGAAGFSYFKWSSYCDNNECCDDKSIPGDVYRLKQDLDRSLFGQHIVIKQVISALTAHVSPMRKSRKPLVLSFHGQPGTGKNFVAEHIASALYRLGSSSAYVTKYLGQADFPMVERVTEYRRRITDEVRASLSKCPRSLFIFDEVDKMPSGVFDTLTSLTDYNAFTDGTDHTKAIFIFLSNTAGTHIADHLGNQMKQGRLREDLRQQDFERLLEKAAYNMDGGLRRTTMIESHVIDHFIPFLPLEKAHVVKCLEMEFGRWNRRPDKNVIDDILNTGISFDRTHGLFAISGCKTLEKKVAAAVN